MTKDILPVTIRRANPDDLEQVLRLDEALCAYDFSYDPTLDLSWTRSEDGVEFFHGRLEGGDGCVYLAENAAGMAIGYLVGGETEGLCYRNVRLLAEVECLYVDPEYRGHQLGARLVEEFRQWAGDRGIERLRIEVSAANTAAVRFYQKLGMVPYNTILESE